jgi:hypothetical protein
MGLLGNNSSDAINDANKQYQQTMHQLAKGYGTLGKGQYNAISPYMNAGTQALSAEMQMLANPMNSQQALSDYYAGPQYDQQMQAANYAANSEAEATGGLGNSATGNALASQSAKMGQDYLTGLGKQRQQQFNNLGGLSRQGLNATNTMGKWAADDYGNAAGLLGNAATANVNAAGAAAQANAAKRGGMMNLASYGAMFL